MGAVTGSSSRPPEAAGGARAELERCLRDSGHNPPVRALPGLIRALIECAEDDVKPLERAIARAGRAAVPGALSALQQGTPAERPRVLSLLVRLLGVSEVAADPSLFPVLLAALDEPLPQSRKLAARALGKLADPRAEPALLSALGHVSTVEQKSLVDALAVLGGPGSLSALTELRTSDADLERRRQRAALLIERRLTRTQASRLVLDRPLARPCRVALTCRAGLAEVLQSELAERWSARVVDPGRVELEYQGSLAELLVARTALDVGLVVPLTAGAAGASTDPIERIADALSQPSTLALFASWTAGTPRFRVEWAGGGHRRAQTWALARALRERTAALTNESHQALWTVHAPPDGRGELRIVPRLEPDPRFSYRVAAVPAASHPSIAAALARIAGVAPDEVVWDPFVGSGLELVERARLGAARELWGNDTDPRALAAARANLAAAGFAFAKVVLGSALTFAPRDVSLIISNPPMGRRVARDGSLALLLESFVRHAASVLRPGGRLVWLSPLERRTERVAHELGLHVSTGPNVDLGGFSARVQIIRRPAR
jgi:predicted RNA methylase